MNYGLNVWNSVKYSDAIRCRKEVFFIKGYQFPVCARCTGVIISYFLALILFKKYKVPWQLCIIMAGIMLTDWSLQYFGIKESTNSRRLVTGLIGGFGLNTLKLKIL